MATRRPGGSVTHTAMQITPAREPVQPQAPCVIELTAAQWDAFNRILAERGEPDGSLRLTMHYDDASGRTILCDARHGTLARLSTAGLADE